METQSMLVVPVGEERELNVYISSQWPTLVQVRREETDFTDGGGARLNSCQKTGSGGRDAGHPVQQGHLSCQADRRSLRGEGDQDLHPGWHHVRGCLEVSPFSKINLLTFFSRSKSLSCIFFVCLVFFLLRTNRAVRCILDRGDDMLITGGRHPVLGKYKVRKSLKVLLLFSGRGVFNKN